MKLKHRIYKLIDISGLQLFDPVARLFFREEPQVQIKRITQFIVIPILAFGLFLLVWQIMAPRHTTKSGEVPKPGRVLDAAKGILTFHNREKEKSIAFIASSDEANKILDNAKNRLEEIESSLIPAQDETIANLEILEQEWRDKNISPKIKKAANIEYEINSKQNSLKTDLEELAGSIKANDKNAKEELVLRLEKLELQKSKWKIELAELKGTISILESKKYPLLERAQRKKDRLEEEKQYLSVYIGILTKNRNSKVEELNKKLVDYSNSFYAAESTKVMSSAKRLVRQKTRIEKTSESQYSAAKTLPYQTLRSLLCVFTGFIIATIVAIPLGILCGLNKTFMCAFTPFIAIFKPVSPIVWLPIGLIVVGGFIPDPENNALLSIINKLPIFSSFDVNPAFLASAITVALCSLWPTLVNTALGVSSIDVDHLNVARVLNLRFRERLISVIIPSALPLIFAGLRISIGVGWMVLIAAELLASSEGIGKFVWDMFNNGSSDSFAQMFVVVFLVGGIGLLLDRIMIVFQRLVSFDETAPSV